VVASLAEKTPATAHPNVHHQTLISAELQGVPIEMNGSIMVAAGEYRQMPDGTLGMHIEDVPEAAMLLRWKSGEFNTEEREVARSWRADLLAHAPEQMIGVVRNILPAETRISDLGALKQFIDAFCASNDRTTLWLALHVLSVPELSQRLVFARWEDAGQPELAAFAPYTTHVFKVDLLYYLGIERGFISGERASNKADMAYLYYLPFTMVFASGDRLHQRTAPLFLTPDQSYVVAQDFKAGLRAIDEWMSELPDEVKEQGVMRFASWPPADLDNLVTQLWDKHMRPDWREISAEREAERGAPRDEVADKQTVEGWKRRLDEATPVSAEEAELELGGEEAAYAIIAQQVPIRKGKWRMVPREAEEAPE
jgi:hypothetical protein